MSEPHPPLPHLIPTNTSLLQAAGGKELLLQILRHPISLKGEAVLATSEHYFKGRSSPAATDASKEEEIVGWPGKPFAGP
jgi:hypothetical protein